MVLAVQIFKIVFYSIAIIFMCSLTFIGIWSFITFNRMYKNQRIQNFLLDKIQQSICKLNLSIENKPENIDSEFNIDELINEDELFNRPKNYDDNIDNSDNINSL